ncbi:MAG: DMT family transporter [candidate division WOR-3 bacterium]|nr:MAG: DMT family transporter [candidate division WOR-3 bacterium]
MEAPIPYLGEGLSLLSAVLWAVAVILFRKSGEKVHPLALNMFKNTLAFVLLLPTMWLFGETLIRPVPSSAYILLLLSGVIGIGLGDTLFFTSLNLLGAGLTGIVICLYSPFIIMLSVLWLGESLALLQVIGAFLIISAVLIATIEKRDERISNSRLLLGILSGVFSSACMAVGIVMIKPLLERSPLLWLTEVRLVGGSVALVLILLLHPRRRRIVNSLISRQSWQYTISGSFFGAYVAMIVWLAGMKYTLASIASALNQTSTIFIFILAGIFLKEPFNVRRTIGIILAVMGVFLVFFG